MLEKLEETTCTLTESMAEAQFYASVYVAALQIDLESTETTDEF
jgi:hypothetical protein